MTIHARQCSGCGQGMSAGYYGVDGTYGCSDDCWFADGYTPEMYAEDYKSDSAYWTEWTIEDAKDDGEGWDSKGHHFILASKNEWRKK